MSVVVITGSGGLIGSEAARHFCEQGYEVIGIDNDMRGYFFGAGGSTSGKLQALQQELGAHYTHRNIDIRDRDAVLGLVSHLGSNLSLLLHAAAQPSHDWAAREPFTDFDINAAGTLNLLEAIRLHAPQTPFIFISTNKVYGDQPNRIALEEQATRFDVARDHPLAAGIAEDMSIDQSMHSLFGVSKLSADLMVQEYGRYFGLHTVCLRGGTLTGPAHSAVELHGFLAYLMHCTMRGKPYTVFGYEGKQVRDVLHSRDVISACQRFLEAPRSAAVYNLGGARYANCSVLEAIATSEQICGRELNWRYEPAHRLGDHRWWISDVSRFQQDYPGWQPQYSIEQIQREIHEKSG